MGPVGRKRCQAVELLSLSAWMCRVASKADWSYFQPTCWKSQRWRILEFGPSDPTCGSVCVCVWGGGKEGKGEGKVGTVSKEGKEKKKATGEGDERKEEERKKNRVRRTNEQWREDKEQTLTAVAH